jgi:hypothetical protein
MSSITEGMCWPQPHQVVFSVRAREVSLGFEIGRRGWEEGERRKGDGLHSGQVAFMHMIAVCRFLVLFVF